MAGPRALRSVLHNFLDTMSSRYSDLDGYWIWGRVVCEVHGMHSDLLAVAEGEAATPKAALVQLARERFAEQLTRHGIAATSVQRASLTVTCVEGATAFVNGLARPGFEISLAVEATANGMQYTRIVSFVAAPHDPMLESRRAPAQRGWAR